MKPRKLLSELVAGLLLVSTLAACGGSPTAAPATGSTVQSAQPTAVAAQPTAAATAQPVAAKPTAAATAQPAAAQPTTAAKTTGSSAESCPAEGGQLVVGLSSEPSKIDPHRTAAENGVLAMMQVCETLVLRDQSSGKYLPGLAESWDVSPDGLDYTFHLRKGIKFQDGTPFNAEAVKYNLDRIIDPDTQSAEAISHIGPYTSTKVLDDYTAVVHLDSPFAPLLTGLSTGWTCMVSPTAAEKYGPEEFQDHFVGTGPFVFKEWSRHEHILLEKNPNYWGGAEFFNHRGNACLDSIVFKFVSESSVRTGTLSTGEIQVAQEISSVDVNRLKEDPNIEVKIMPSAGTGVLLLFNVSKAPTDDLKVRQALNYGIDQKAISDILYEGVLAPSYGPLSSNTPCAWSGAEQMYKYDPEKAKSLLEEAGWKDTNGDGIREKNGQQLVLAFPTHGEFPLYRDPAVIVQSQLKDIGAQVDVEKLSAAAWIDAGSKGDLNIGIVDWRDSDPDIDLRNMFMSTNASGFAWNHHSNKTLDDLLTKGMVTQDSQERCKAYEDVQKIIMNDAMIKPTTVFAAVWGVRKNVQGLKIDTFGPSFFWAVDAYLQK